MPVADPLVQTFKPRAVAFAQRALSRTAKAAWPLVEHYSRLFERPSPHPAWAPAPLLKRRHRSFPQLGWPRDTDSLCPQCVKDVRRAILDGEGDLRVLLEGRPGEIKARILEREGKIVMVKDCSTHGCVEDVLSIDPEFLRRIEALHPGRDFLTPPTALRNHGKSSIQYGRGSVLTVDLTNRCNMMCDPCFMDANQVGYIHELSWEDIKKILDDALTIEPRRQMSVQFSGGEPTLSPHFLRAIAYARTLGFFCVQAATNGVRFAEDPELARAAKQAGMRLAYLQFDGVTNAAHAHRNVANLFDVKLRAIENLHAAGIDVVLVVTVINGVNDHQVGPIVDFAVANADKITVVSFQPVSFSGRAEDVSDEVRRQQRYTLSHLVHDVRRQTGVTEPLRDWFPLSALGPFGDLTDLLLGARQDWGSMKCGCHPNCGVGTVLFVHKKTKKLVALADFIDVERLLLDVQQITDAGRGRSVTRAAVVLALLKNFKPDKAPPGFTFFDLVRQFLSQTGARGSRVGEFDGDAREFEWRALFVAGMWFQDLFNYDFRRTEMCIIPYGTQMGEISFCAYNTGIGWRSIVEKMKASAPVAEWYRTRGRHPVHARGEPLAVAPPTGTVALPSSTVALQEREDGGHKRRVRLRLVVS